MTARWGLLLISVGCTIVGATEGRLLAAEAPASPAPKPVLVKSPPSLQPAPEAASPASPSPVKTTEPTWPKVLPDVKADAKEEAKAEAAPDVWPAEDIIMAKAHCAQILKGVEAQIEEAEPIKEGECGTPAPVKLISIGSNPTVAFSPAPTLTCDMVATLANWLKNDLQQLARSHLGGPVVKIETMSSYSCRNAYGRKKTRLSEHGRVNALDVRGFVTAQTVEAAPLADWGMTEREVRAVAAQSTREKAGAEIAAQVAKPGATVNGWSTTTAKAQVETADQGTKTTKQENGGKDSAAAPSRIAGTVADGSPKVGLFGQRLETIVDGISPARTPAMQPGPKVTFGLLEPSRLGGPKPQTTPGLPILDLATRKALFLRAAHTSACQRFGTVLGPEADDYHRNHFHLDMAERTIRKICE